MTMHGYKKEICMPGLRVAIVGDVVLLGGGGGVRRHYKIASYYIVERDRMPPVRRGVQPCRTWHEAQRAAVRKLAEHMPHVAAKLLAGGHIDAHDLPDATLERFAAL